MASRLDIEKSRLIYTQDIGWIDRNHALGGDAATCGRNCSQRIPHPITKIIFWSVTISLWENFSLKWALLPAGL
ncbi:hypothetical protein TUM12151_24450 [Morganella morganii]|nr:hypothetical protein TUM12149_23190 [Morganella morganii]GIZ30402.1 hypothetical protein TUM12150_08880 [Morganella morganii]GIZ35459.1 hypothetical protein TUM12151_24450 [Morganella morganii]